MRTLLLPLIVVLALAGCNTNINSKYPPFRFAEKGVINLDVANIEVQESFAPTMREPNVEHLFPVSLNDSIKTWVADRLRASGQNRQLKVTIADASVVEEKLPVKAGVKGFFTEEQSAEYKARIVVEIRVYSEERNTAEGEVAVTVTRNRSIKESATLAEKEEFLYLLARDLMNDLDAELDKNLKQHFGNYILYQ